MRASFAVSGLLLMVGLFSLISVQIDTAFIVEGASHADSASSESDNGRVSLHSKPVMFVENVGQFDDAARFQVRGAQGAVWLAGEAIWLTVLEPLTQNDDNRFDHFALDERAAIGPQRGVNIRLSGSLAKMAKG